ncbi:unnamed protein product [Tuber aestivum]|uniref:Uncharacterized protein n=1 Tax=Tuber aestivum TaxID=59557 RepID=A0A292Q5C6_9PEZI|nr:unnamed protein product [Tuber aestivum]
MPTRVIIRSDHERLYHEYPLYCPIYECRSFIPQARIDSQGVRTCIRCAAKSCCFCGKLGVHASHLNCPVVIHMMEQSFHDEDLADLYRAMGRSGGRGGIEGSANGDEHVGATTLFRLSIALGDGLASAADAMINSSTQASPEDLGGIETTDPPNRLPRDPYRVNSTRATRPMPITTIPTGASPTAPASPASGSDLRTQVESSPAAPPIAPTNTTAADIDMYHGGLRARLPESLRRQMPDQDQFEVQRNRHRFAFLRRVRQREYRRVVGSGFTHP